MTDDAQTAIEEFEKVVDGHNGHPNLITTGDVDAARKALYDFITQAEMAEVEELRRRLAEAVRERDEARYHADTDVCCSIECGTTPPGKDGWWKNSECDEYELRYAAKRGFIERHPERPTWFKFTAAGKEIIK